MSHNNLNKVLASHSVTGEWTIALLPSSAEGVEGNSLAVAVLYRHRYIRLAAIERCFLAMQKCSCARSKPSLDRASEHRHRQQRSERR